MALNVSAWAIRSPLPTLLLFIALALAGLWSYRLLPVQSMPAADIPIVQVTVAQAGAAPGDLELQVARRIEGALAGVQGIRHITSVLTTGQSQTTVEFQLDVAIDRASADVRDAVAKIADELPAGAREPVIERLDIAGLPLQIFVVTGDGSDDLGLSRFVDDVVVRDLQGVRGVGLVRREGGSERELRIELDPARIQALGLGVDRIDAALRAALADQPGGIQVADGRERLVRMEGSRGIRTAAGLAGVRLAVDGRPVRIGDLGRVVDAGTEATVRARLDGVPGVGFSVFKAKGHSEVAVADALAARLDAVGRDHPGYRIRAVTDWVQPTRDTFHGALMALIEGAALAVVVVWLFLRDARATLIAAVAIPLSVVPTFLVMHLLGYSLNTMSLLAISLVAGILVDDAIVEVENIARYQRQGLGAYRAAMIGADRIGLAVVATTLVVVAMFLPTAFMPGVAGKFFIEFGITVAVAVLFSLLVARLLTPLMAAHMLSDQPPAEAHGGRFAARFARFIDWTLAWRWVTVGVAAALLAAAVLAAGLLPTGFYTPVDRSQFTVQVEVPAGTSLDRAHALVDEAVAAIRGDPAVTSVFARIAVPIAELTVNLVPPQRRDGDAAAVAARLRPALSALPDRRIGILSENGTRDVVINVLGDVAADRIAAAEALARAMRAAPEFANVSVPALQRRAGLTVTPRPEAAARAGVDAAALAAAARIASEGDDASLLARLPIDGRLVPVRVRLDPAARSDPAALTALRVALPGGASAPLAAVAEIAAEDGPATLRRSDRVGALAIEADLAGGAVLGTALAAARALPAWRDAPPGVRIAAAGDAENMDELFTGFAMAVAVGLVSIYLLLVLLYRHPLHPVPIMLSLPFSAVGAVLALLLAGKPLDLAALIGILMLLGIVAKNAILVVDEALQRRAAGEPLRAALRAAALTRARAITMTTVAMIAGMLPIVLGASPDAAFRAPMAWVVIGGLASSTLLSLAVVPAMVSLTDDLRAWLAARWRSWAGPAPAASGHCPPAAASPPALISEAGA